MLKIFKFTLKFRLSVTQSTTYCTVIRPQIEANASSAYEPKILANGPEFSENFIKFAGSLIDIRLQPLHLRHL